MERTVAISINNGPPVVLTLGSQPVTIGRGSAATVRVDHPLVSRTHLVLGVDAAGQPTVTDPGTVNGSFNAGTRVSQLTVVNPVLLHLGDPTSGAAVAISLAASAARPAPFPAPPTINEPFGAQSGPLGRQGPPPPPVTPPPAVPSPGGQAPGVQGPSPTRPAPERSNAGPSTPLPAAGRPTAPPSGSAAGGGVQPPPPSAERPGTAGPPAGPPNSGRRRAAGVGNLPPGPRPAPPSTRPQRINPTSDGRGIPAAAGQQGPGRRVDIDFSAPHMQSLQYRPVRPAGPGLAPTSPPPAPEPIAKIDGEVTIGRTAANDIVVRDVLASRHHARLTPSPQGLVLQDLRSVNGTFVNGRRITRITLSDGDLVTIGNTDFRLQAGQLVRPADDDATAGVLVHDVSLDIDHKRLLTEISLAAKPGTLTALIGPSGAGKSTLSKVIAGLSTPTTGTVTFEGRPVHADYEALRTRIGMVPQDDVLHPQLTVRRALQYAAQLRLPPDMTSADRDRVIDGVLAELQLTQHSETRIDKLSGGQRKRASVAMELLTGPSLLILDEPTSGLDPALDRQVMKTLRRLADAGRVVIVVTHSVAHLAQCDQIVLLAPGGKAAFIDAPSQVENKLGTPDWAEVFEDVTANPEGAYRRFLSQRQKPPTPPQFTENPPQSRRTASFGRQLSTLVRRQTRLVFADRGYLIFLVGLPLVLGLLSLVIPGGDGFSNSTKWQSVEAKQLLLVLTIGAVFMGMSLTVRDLVAERSIYSRERAVGLRAGAYLWSKILVFGVALAVQVVIMLGVTYLGKSRSTRGVFLMGWAELGIDLVIVGLVSVVIGLCVSSFVRSQEQSMPPLVVLVMVQLVFSGGLFNLVGRVGLEQVAWISPSFWGFASGAASVDLNKLTPPPPDLLKQGDPSALWNATSSNLLTDWGILAGMAVLVGAITYARLNRKVT